MRRGGRSQVSRPRLVRAFAAPAVTGSLAATLPPVVRSESGTFSATGLPAEAPAWVNGGNLRTEYQFNEAEGANPTVSGWSGANSWNRTTPTSGLYTCRTQVTDATAPKSPSAVARSWFKAGMHDDASLMVAGVAWNNDWFYRGDTVWNKFFLTLWFRIDPAFVWQTGINGMKLIWLPASYTNSQANWFIGVSSTGTNTYVAGIIDNALGQFGSETYGARTRTTTVTLNKGDWVRLSLESLASHNNVANGSVNLWVNGTNQGEAASGLVKHSPDAALATANINGVRVEPYFGGAASITLSADQYVDWDHVSVWAED